jgi:hypothetical protein
MGETLIDTLAALVALYVGVGVLWGVPFVARGVDRIDPDAEHGSLGFRLAILPGVVALWPWMLRRARSGKPARERSPHRDAAEIER